MHNSTSTLNVFFKPSEEGRESAELCGYAYILMSMSASHARYPALYLRTTLEQAIGQGKIKYYFNDCGKPVGYVVWAFLAKDVEQRFFKTGQMNLHPSEWDEGDALWIIDFLAPLGHLKYILRDLRDSVFLGKQDIKYYRIKKNKIITKRMSRNSHSYFFAGSAKSAGEQQP